MTWVRSAALALLALAGSVSAAWADEIQIVKSGKYYGTLEGYRVGEDFYLAARDAARIYGARLYWFPVAKAVQLSFRTRQVRFEAESRQANVDGKAVEMTRATILRASQALIPVSFFCSQTFSDLSGVDSKFNAKTRLLLVDQRSNVGPLRWFTYPDHTRVVLELDPDLRYQSSKRGADGFDVGIPNGVIEWSEKTDVQDGVVEYVHLFQDKSEAHLALKLAKGGGELALRELKAPRRIVIDVARARETAAQPAAAPAPEQTPQAEAAPQSAGGRLSHEAPAPPGEPAVQAARARPQGAVSGASGERVSPDSPRKYRIAIDAGHGGKDGGAVGRRGTLEKDINLHFAQELEELLRQEDRFEVMLTRGEDEFIPLGDRARLANEFRSDLFISLHCNANRSRSQTGYEIYFLSERASDPDAERLAQFENSVLALEDKEAEDDPAAPLLYALAKTEDINGAAEMAGVMTRAVSQRVDLPDRGVKQAAFYVLRGVHAPAVLVEMGFLTNARDEAKLQSVKYRRKIVEGLYAGVLDYARRRGW